MIQLPHHRWRPTSTRELLWVVGIVIAIALLIIVICGYAFGWKWTSLPKRTLWDWLELLIIPAVLAGGGLWFNRQQREQELQTADRRAQDEALQAYLEHMSDLLIPNKDRPSLYDEDPPDSLKSVARARSLTVLPRLDGDRKARVVQFLYESGLISTARLVLALNGADLREANLNRADLREADLSGADLSEANLSKARLHKARLAEAYLVGTKLSEAILIEVDLGRAHLGGANLSEARLHQVNLSGAVMRNADLRGPT